MLRGLRHSMENLMERVGTPLLGIISEGNIQSKCPVCLTYFLINM